MPSQESSADAIKLPLPADHFDVVTCQTLLMHLRDPIAAMREMFRIARPGGLIVAVEPNNFINRLEFNSLTWDKDDDELSRRFRFWLCYHRGKIRNGEGNDTIGEHLPGYFANSGSLKSRSIAPIKQRQSIRPITPTSRRSC